ncbi:hypothetical protein [Nostoc sp. TCL26-01]|uniref:hypothetical protein n=1 Tax=Nostoc sp. TCL26-01 TaxID=2576904 RepID=UPI0015B7FECC|nr:hypothetical protein [Nostoc sp. TCL26-01]
MTHLVFSSDRSMLHIVRLLLLFITTPETSTLATRSRSYTNKTHRRGLKILELSRVCVVANYIRPTLFKQPLGQLDSISQCQIGKKSRETIEFHGF